MQRLRQQLSGPRSASALPRAVPSASSVVDIRPLTEPDVATLFLRVQHLEAGVRLIAETLKRCFEDLSSSVKAVRDQKEGAASLEIERSVGAALQPLHDAIGALTESVQGLPLVFASATDRLAQRVESVRTDVEENLIAVLSRPPGSVPGSSGLEVSAEAIWGASGEDGSTPN